MSARAPDPLGGLACGVAGYGRAVDDGVTVVQTGRDRIDHFQYVGVGRHTDDDRLRVLARVHGIFAGGDAVFRGEVVGLAAGAVVNPGEQTGLGQVGSHAVAHAAEAQKCSLHIAFPSVI